MDRIATPRGLVAELQKILAYAETEKPSREKLATALNALADRTARAPQMPGSKDIDDARSSLVIGLASAYPGVDRARVRVVVNKHIDQATRELSRTEGWVSKTF
jgi:hypothetical protein